MDTSPRTSGDIKAARFLNQIELERILNNLMYEMESGSLDEVIIDPARKPIEQMVAKIILEAIERGDAIRLDFLLNRLVGKVKEKVEHSGKVTLADLVTASQEKEE